MQGILLIDKPPGWTSFDAVNYVRKIAASVENKKPKQIKVGHTGTLDPFATGLLVVLVGKEFTRKAAGMSKADKTYEVTMRLGAVSSTGDPEGEITPVSDTVPTEKALLEALEGFRGPILQVPPAYSAVKIGGRRAYKLAREGKKVEIEARPVTVNRLELVGYAYPDVRLAADVSSGTYIRSLAEDIGKALGTGAYTSALRRTRVGEFDVRDSVEPKALSADSFEALNKF